MPLEIQQVPQVEKSFPEAVGKIADLYKKVFLDTEEGRKQRDERWRSAALESSVCSDQITELGEVMKVVDIKRKEFPDIKKYAELFFGQVKEEPARNFLRDIWWSRIAIPDDHDKVIYTGGKVARNIFGDMGIELSTCGKPLKKITLELAISSFLQGKLQPKPTLQPK